MFGLRYLNLKLSMWLPSLVVTWLLNVRWTFVDYSHQIALFWPKIGSLVVGFISYNGAEYVYANPF